MMKMESLPSSMYASRLHFPQGDKKARFKKKQQDWGGKGKQAWGGGGGGQRAEEAQQALSVYKRVPVLPPAFSGFRGPTDRFLQPGEPQYDEVRSA